MKNKVLIAVLISTNLVLLAVSSFLYMSISIGKAHLNEEIHHLSLKEDILKGHLLDISKGLTLEGYIEKVEFPIDAKEIEIRNGLAEINLLHFKVEDGKINGIE